MGTEELILDLKIMSNIYQSQIHKPQSWPGQGVIEDSKGQSPDPNINTGGPCPGQRFTPASHLCPSIKTGLSCDQSTWQTRFEVKDNNGKMSWFSYFRCEENWHDHQVNLSATRFTNAFGHKGRLCFDPERVKDLGLDTWWSKKDIFWPLLSFRCTCYSSQAENLTQCNWEVQKVQEVSLNHINIGDLLQSNSMIQWFITVKYMYNRCI